MSEKRIRNIDQELSDEYIKCIKSNLQLDCAKHAVNKLFPQVKNIAHITFRSDGKIIKYFCLKN